MTDQAPTKLLPGRVLVTLEPLLSAEEKTSMTAGNHHIGGVCMFEGLVREFSGNGDDSLTLEREPGMTERALEDIREEAARRWTLQGLTILHRVGRMLPGDGIVAVNACSRHRQNDLDACSFTINYNLFC